MHMAAFFREGKIFHDKPTAPASTWQNGFAERLIGSIRRECMDDIIVLNETHLRRVLKSYADYFNSFKAHRSVKDASFLARFSEPA
jgi:transposase InsO family protein